MKRASHAVGRRTVLGLMASAPAWGWAQGKFPTREVRMIVPWNPGGAVDMMARTIAKVADADGLRLIVENLPGASGAIGLAKVAAAAPDGYTLGMSSTAQLGLVAQGLTKTRNDQFTYLNLTCYDQLILLVPASSPVRDIDGFLKLMKERPGAVSIAAAGSANLSHILATTTAKLAGVDFVFAPYPGGAKAILDLAGGQIDAAVLKPAEVKGQIDAGMVRPIGIYGKHRLKSMPDVPTFAEKGYDVYPFGTMIPASWIAGPAHMPPDVTAWLTQTFRKAIASRDYQAFLNNNDITAGDLSGEELKKFAEQQQERYHTVLPQIVKKQS